MKVSLRLYIAGHTVISQQIYHYLEDIFSSRDDIQFEIDVVDVLERPDIAVNDKVLATPTLIKRLPFPRCKVIGDLNNGEAVLNRLGLLEGVTIR
ncbi:circadian clock KaiB family protein [Aliikangiella sp. IMCC44359]|uniref:circadian clock KaiB family protein n=1 Tax=Aliikangiella sp. IMCC44359 TaxID=3459125 RepID=UPI00403A89E9